MNSDKSSDAGTEEPKKPGPGSSVEDVVKWVEARMKAGKGTVLRDARGCTRFFGMNRKQRRAANKG